jgi:hypothetical protein
MTNNYATRTPPTFRGGNRTYRQEARMNMRGRSRAWVVALAVAATGLGVLPAVSSAAPRRAQCATINKNIDDELGWEKYYLALTGAYLDAGDDASAISAGEMADTYASLVDGGRRLLAKLGC